MATSGQVSKTVTGSDTLIFKWWIDSQSVSGNYSNISWQLILQSGSYGKIVSSASKSWSVTVNGTNYSGTNSVAIGNNTSKVLASGTTQVTHNADGTKTFSFSFSQQFSITFSGSSIGTISGSGSGTPTTIPRASTPTLSATSVEVGKGLTVTTNRASTAFTHKLYYSIGNGWVSIATGIGASYAWTVASAITTNTPNATSRTVTLKLETYNGSTKIGEKTITFTATIPASVKPSISAVTVTEAVSGLATKFEAFIQNQTKLKFAITASGASGSTISEVKTVVDEQTLTGASPTSGVIKTSGTLTATITVKDSRGRTASTTKSITVLAYTKPSIKTFTAERSNASGTAQDDGTNAKISYKTDITSLNSTNDNSIKIEYRQVGATTWTNLFTITGYSLDTSQVTGAVFSGDNSYEIKITVADYFSTITQNINLSTAFVTYDVHESGKGWAFGKVAELAEYLDVNFISKFRKLVHIDKQIVKNGESAKWIEGRDKALIRLTSILGNSPILSQKTTNGSWELSAYDVADYEDHLVLSFAQDSKYNAGTNETYRCAFVPDKAKTNGCELILTDGNCAENLNMKYYKASETKSAVYGQNNRFCKLTLPKGLYLVFGLIQCSVGSSSSLSCTIYVNGSNNLSLGGGLTRGHMNNGGGVMTEKLVQVKDASADLYIDTYGYYNSTYNFHAYMHAIKIG